jgi:SAM-dependent methyltransferase
MEGHRVTNEWTKAEHALAYLAQLSDVPHRQAGEATLLEEVPAGTRRILDLGCGNGHLLAIALAHCPQASGVGLDFSATMLEEAGKQFAGNSRVKLVEHNLDAPLPPLGRFDAVVSSFAIHHCEDDRKRQLYREVWDVLEPGGVFCNLEHVASPTVRIHLQFLNAMGTLPEEEDLSNKLCDVATQLCWLREIGYADVDCHWKWRELALLVGHKPA